LEGFELRNQIPRRSKADVIGTLVEKFLDPQLKLSVLDNHAMGSVLRS
jgi:type I restriction enzyme M protein